MTRPRSLQSPSRPATAGDALSGFKPAFNLSDLEVRMAYDRLLVVAGGLATLTRPEQQQWRPISTAPRGTPILATDGKLIVVLERGECAGEDWPDPVGFSGYEWEWDFDWKHLTHWLPLPAPPSPAQDECVCAETSSRNCPVHCEPAQEDQGSGE